MKTNRQTTRSNAQERRALIRRDLWLILCSAAIPMWLASARSGALTKPGYINTSSLSRDHLHEHNYEQ